MILFVDIEHESAWAKPIGQLILAARTKITYNLQEISGETCLLQHYTTVDQALLETHGITAMFLSGSSTDPDQYGDQGLDTIRDLIVAETVPVFGFCGGYQLMMEARGSTITRIGRLEPGEEKAEPDYMPGWKTETGYLPITTTGTHPLLDGLGPDPVFRHFHGWEIRDLPDGFVNYASTSITEHQMAVNEDARQLGTQFHPEYFTDDHVAGRRLIENFCRWANVGT